MKKARWNVRLVWVMVSIFVVAAAVATAAFLIRGRVQAPAVGTDPVPLKVMRAERDRSAEKVVNVRVVDKQMEAWNAGDDYFELCGLAIDLRFPARPDSIDVYFKGDPYNESQIALSVEGGDETATYRGDQVPSTSTNLAGTEVSISGKQVGATSAKLRRVVIERPNQRPLVASASFGNVTLTLFEDSVSFADIALFDGPKESKETAIKMIEHRLDSHRAPLAIGEARGRLRNLLPEERLRRFLEIDATALVKSQPISELAENATLAVGRSYFPVVSDVTRMTTDVGRMYAYHAGPEGKHFIEWVFLNSTGDVKLGGTLRRRVTRDEDYLRAFLNAVRWKSPATKE